MRHPHKKHSFDTAKQLAGGIALHTHIFIILLDLSRSRARCYRRSESPARHFEICARVPRCDLRHAAHAFRHNFDVVELDVAIQLGLEPGAAAQLPPGGAGGACAAALPALLAGPAPAPGGCASQASGPRPGGGPAAAHLPERPRGGAAPRCCPAARHIDRRPHRPGAGPDVRGEEQRAAAAGGDVRGAGPERGNREERQGHAVRGGPRGHARRRSQGARTWRSRRPLP
jgi:hypothetical protein